MRSDDKYYGIYRGLVADNNDPDGLGRVKLVIPQVLGQSVTTWAWPVGGGITQSKWPYGTFYTNTDQAVGINTATKVVNWLEADTSKAYLGSNRLYVEETGDYFFQFSAMFIKTNASAGTADMWIRKNGTNVPDSNTRITLSGSNAEVVMAVSFILDLDAGDYLELYCSASASNTFISHSPAGVGPAVPGVVATLNLVGKWKPQPNTGVWVMFEGGDPHFPVWFGGF